MACTTIKASTYGANRKHLSHALRNLIPFKTSGALNGHASWHNSGRLTGDELERYFDAVDAGFRYVVTSYDTPIAWVTNDGEVYRVHQDHYQNHSNEAEVWVCGCCARMVNTGDESGCRDFHGHTHPTCDKNIVRADIEHTFEVGYFRANCNGCGEIVRTGGTLYAAIRLTNN